MNFRQKILSLDELPKWRNALRQTGKRLVVTNGCFDLLHLGHVTYLEAGRKQGDALLIGLNGDKSVEKLKGPGRPINCEGDRAAVLAALQSVDAVCIFNDTTAERFLSIAQPDIYLKGGDYTLESINQNERRVVEKTGGAILLMPVVPGRSTTQLLKKIAEL